MSARQNTFQQINSLCQQAEAGCETGDYATAIAHFKRAWALLPESEQTSRMAAWILSGWADAHFSCAQFSQCLTVLQQAQRCTSLATHPMILLRLGQCYYEQGDHERAGTYLLAAYQTGGKGVFADEAPHYLASIHDRIDDCTPQLPDALRPYRSEELRWLQVLQ